MAEKRKSAPAVPLGQRSVASFFSPKPAAKPAAAGPGEAGAGEEAGGEAEAKKLRKSNPLALLPPREGPPPRLPEPVMPKALQRAPPPAAAGRTPPSQPPPAAPPPRSRAAVLHSDSEDMEADYPQATPPENKAANKPAAAAAKPAPAPAPAPARPRPPPAPAAPKPPLALPGDAARFADRSAQRYPFLSPPALRDGQGRAPGDALYDPGSLQLPAGFPRLRDAGGGTVVISPAQEQWWRLKAAHFDCILFFKVGKFYELFETDAHVGAALLGLAYMKGDAPHTGFPEKNYEAHAEALARAGHRVLVVEQVETPEAMEARKRATGAKDKVVRREAVALLSRGTLTDPVMLAAAPDAAYLAAIVELPASEEAGGGEEAEEEAWVGLAACDCAAGRILLGAWRDDARRAHLRRALAELRPAEALLPRGAASAELLSLLRTAPGRPPDVRLLPPGERFWVAQRCAAELDRGRYFEGAGGGGGGGGGGGRGRFAGWPPMLVQLLTDGGSFPGGYSGRAAAALGALGGLLSGLREAMLDADILPLRRFTRLAAEEAGGAAAWAAAGHVAVDASALEALEVLENGEGGARGSLLAALDSCCSGAGRRRLRGWLCRPLRCAAAIRARQEAVCQLREAGAAATGAARRALRGAPDLERSLARLAALAGGRGRDAAHVVLYEDAGKKRVATLVAALRGARAVARAAAALAVAGGITSPLLAALVNEDEGPEEAEEGEGVRMPPLSRALAPFERAFDWEEAERSGRVTLAPGADAALDAADASLAAAGQGLEAWLADARRGLGAGGAVSFVAAARDTHLVEVPDGALARVPRDWVKQSTRKGFTRFSAPALEQLKAARADAAAAREAALGGVLRGLIDRLLSQAPIFAAAAEAAATLDALISLAAWAEELGGGGGGGGGGGSFVPNDVSLGGACAPVVVLTGPNMGGKSTLLRTVCLAALLAHIGADVPASAFECTAMDALFVRMGANDDLAGGRSTFAVELLEASAVLRRATPDSLVALDELGRGTSTHDGAAIAHAVLQSLARGGALAPRTLFSTHYHALSESAPPAACALAHMGIALGAPRAPGGAEEVTFLYRLQPGACPKSYGVNVARLAGLPDALLQRAAGKAAEMEETGRGRGWALSAGEAEALAYALRAAKGLGDAGEACEMARRALEAAAAAAA